MTARYTAEWGKNYRINCCCQATRHSSPTLSVLPITNLTSAQLLAPLFFSIFGLSTHFSVILSSWLFPKPWHLSLLHLMWTWAKGNRAKATKKRSKTRWRTNLVTHKSLIEKDTGFMLYPATVSKGNRATACPCRIEVANMIETATHLKISSIIQYMSHMHNFYIDSDSVCMSTGCLPSLAEHISHCLSLALAGKFGNGQHKWLQALITAHTSYPAFISFTNI